MENHMRCITGMACGLTATLLLASTSSAALIGKWTFNENTGTTASDSSGGGIDGTLFGPTWVPGQGALGTNYALQFDGLDDFVRYGDNANLTNYNVTGNFSMEAWINLDQTFGQGLIFGQSAVRYGLSAYFARAYQTVDSSPGTEKFGNFAANTYQHVVGVWTEDASPGFDLVEVWVEGASAGFLFVPEGTAFPDHNADVYWTGKSSSNAAFGYLTGDIDEIRYYNHALTGAEIAANLAAGPTLVPEPSVALAGLGCLALYRNRRRAR